METKNRRGKNSVCFCWLSGDFPVAYFLSRKTIGTAINLDSLRRAVTAVFPPFCSLTVDRGHIYFISVFRKFIDFRNIALRGLLAERLSVFLATLRECIALEIRRSSFALYVLPTEVYSSQKFQLGNVKKKSLGKNLTSSILLKKLRMWHGIQLVILNTLHYLLYILVLSYFHCSACIRISQMLNWIPLLTL